LEKLPPPIPHSDDNEKPICPLVSTAGQTPAEPVLGPIASAETKPTLKPVQQLEKNLEEKKGR
jgi:hypothetical protein